MERAGADAGRARRFRPATRARSWWLETSRGPSRPPAMGVHLGAAVPAWSLRAVAFALAVAAGALVTNSGVTTALLVLAAVPVAVAPGTALPVLTAGLIGWGLLAGDADPLLASVVVLCVPAFLLLGRLTGGVGWQARIELGALRRAGQPFLVFQVLAQVMMHLAFVLPAAGRGSLWAGVAALAALTVLTGLLGRRLRATT